MRTATIALWTLLLAATMTAGNAPVANATPTDAQKCAALKMKAAGKKALAKLKCHARATLQGVAVDPLCLTNAEQKFSDTFARAESNWACATVGDEAAIEAQVDAFVASVVAQLPTQPFPTATPIPTATATPVCSPGQTLCGGLCKNLNTDPDNCGNCGTVCPLGPNVATAICSGGACYMGSCSVGYQDCNAVSGDGCEVNTTSDNSNCGGCGNVCMINYTCTGSSCLCNSNCANGVACVTNSQCQSYRCNAGMCQACAVDGDCAPGYFCVGSVCTPP